MKKFGKIISGILASLSMHGVAPSIPVLSGSVASASAVANKSDVYDKFKDICRKVSDQKGYDSSKPIDDSGDKIYIHCKNGNKVKVSKEDFASIQRYFHMSFGDLLESYDYEKGIIVKDARRGYAAAPAGYLTVLKRFDNTRIDSFLPGLPTGWRNQGLITVENLAEYILKNCDDCSDKIKKENVSFMKKGLGDSTFEFYRGNFYNFYDFEAILAGLCSYAKEMENWCEKLRKLKEEEVPLAVNLHLLDDWSYGTGWGSGFFKQWGYTCVRSVVISVLNLFVKV